MRVKTKLLTAFVGIGVSAFVGAANADIANHVIKFSASVPSSCTLSPSVNKTGGFADDSDIAESAFTIPVSETTAQATTGALTLGTVSCTGGSIQVTLSADDWIKNKNNTLGGEIQYGASIVVNTQAQGSSITIGSSTPGTASTTITNPTSAPEIGVNISTNTTPNLPVGTYEGTLTLSIGPA